MTRRKGPRPYDDVGSTFSFDLEALSALYAPVALNSALRASGARIDAPAKHALTRKPACAVGSRHLGAEGQVDIG